MKQRHVILKFDYVDTTWKTLISKIVFPLPIRDVMLEIVNFSPSASLFMFSCYLLDDDSFFSNFEKEPVISMTLGGMIGGNPVKEQVRESKSDIRKLTIRMFKPGRRIIYRHIRNHARAHLVIHHGDEDLMKSIESIKMKETVFLLRLTQEDEANKIHSINYRLPKAIYGAKFLKVINWFASGGYH